MTQRALIEALATFFYLGKAPIAPGTFGTAGAIPLALLLGLTHPAVYVAATVVIAVASVGIADSHEAHLGIHDSRTIVIDEVVGFLVAMALLPHNPKTVIAAFVVFRALDILKPFPISIVDRRIHGGLGVVLDDAVAGAFTNIILQLLLAYTTWLH